MSERGRLIMAKSIQDRKQPCVLQDWVLKLTMQQQSVLFLACRGPDNIDKFNPVKQVVTRYRAAVLKAAYLGRPMKVDEKDNTTFMTLYKFSDTGNWIAMCKVFFDLADLIPIHYYSHLAHGAEIIGYKHPEALFRERWFTFYFQCCHHLHMSIETEVEMDERLSDWHRKYWDAG